jgi:hypothetical protein
MTLIVLMLWNFATFDIVQFNALTHYQNFGTKLAFISVMLFVPSQVDVVVKQDFNIID